MTVQTLRKFDVTDQQYGMAVAKLIAKAWMDEAFKARFVAEPAACLKEAGLDVPEGLDVRVDEQLETPWKLEPAMDRVGMVYTIGLPAMPTDLEIEDLADLSERHTAVSACLTCYCCL